MLDALDPFVSTLADELNNGVELGSAWEAAARASTEAAQATAGMTPKIGRARPLAERSVGTPDAGATSLALVVTTVTRFFN